MPLEFVTGYLNRELPVNLDALLVTFRDQRQDFTLQLLKGGNASIGFIVEMVELLNDLVAW